MEGILGVEVQQLHCAVILKRSAHISLLDSGNKTQTGSQKGLKRENKLAQRKLLADFHGGIEQENAESERMTRIIFTDYCHLKLLNFRK